MESADDDVKREMGVEGTVRGQRRPRSAQLVRQCHVPGLTRNNQYHSMVLRFLRVLRHSLMSS